MGNLLHCITFCLILVSGNIRARMMFLPIFIIYDSNLFAYASTLLNRVGKINSKLHCISTTGAISLTPWCLGLRLRMRWKCIHSTIIWSVEYCAIITLTSNERHSMSNQGQTICLFKTLIRLQKKANLRIACLYEGKRKCIIMTSWWARWCLKSPASPLFTQSFVQE